MDNEMNQTPVNGEKKHITIQNGIFMSSKKPLSEDKIEEITAQVYSVEQDNFEKTRMLEALYDEIKFHLNSDTIENFSVMKYAHRILYEEA